MAKTLLNGFKVKVLVNRQDETIKLLSEASSQPTCSATCGHRRVMHFNAYSSVTPM